jgi:hypothetical protein
VKVEFNLTTEEELDKYLNGVSDKELKTAYVYAKSNIVDNDEKRMLTKMCLKFKNEYENLNDLEKRALVYMVEDYRNNPEVV